MSYCDSKCSLSPGTTCYAAAARADAHQRARILRAAASRIMGHTANHTLDRGEAGHFPVAELDARDAAARQESIGNGETS